MNIELKKGANMEAKHTPGPWTVAEKIDDFSWLNHHAAAQKALAKAEDLA